MKVKSHSLILRERCSESGIHQAGGASYSALVEQAVPRL